MIAPGRRPAAPPGLLLAVVTAMLAACSAEGGPSIDAVSPTVARRGDRVVVTGREFCSRAGADCWRATSGFVDFGLNPPSVRAPVVRWEATQIEVSVPTAVELGGTEIIVTVDGLSSNAVDFEVQ